MTQDAEPDPRKYVRLAALLRDRIQDGGLRPGQPAPSIAALSKEHGIARQTCAKAFHLLEDEGLLIRVPGLGYFTDDAAKATDQPVPVLRVATLMRREDDSR